MTKRRRIARKPALADTIIRGQVWYVDLGEPVGHESGFDRPFIVMSVDQFNEGGAGVVIGVPVTSTDHRVPLHVPIGASEADLESSSFAQPEGLRAISKERLRRALGHVSDATLASIEDSLRILLGL